MAHLTLASLDHAPNSALDVCFGMGTTYRSLLSWDIPTTAVELVPSVPRLFWYYHADASQLLRSPLSRVIIDDGRRYLERTSEQYDVINLDPPPPVRAAGSSMLYSTEFYATAKRRLRPGGILEQWLPLDQSDDPVVVASVARALQESFPYLRVFHSATVRGFLFLASSNPIAVQTPASLVKRMPATAIHDLLEWGPAATPEDELADILNGELSVEAIIAEAPQATTLNDDRPVNEYYVLRHLRMSREWQHLAATLGL
jgi:spermidine synthase